MGRPSATARLHRLLLPLAAFAAVLPMLLDAPTCGHDFDFHLLSWLEAARQLAHGVYPVWAWTPAWNAGEPRFLFYPPLSWLLGALLGLVLPWDFVPGTYTFLTLTLAGFTAYRLASRIAPPQAATIAAAAYLLNPYMLFTAYERSAFGELLAAALLPLLFSAALAQRTRVLPVAGAMAMVWLANAPAGVMGSYALAGLTLFRLLQRAGAGRLQRAGAGAGRASRLHLASVASAGMALSLALAGFYLVPAVVERPLIQANMALVGGMSIADNFLFHQTSPATPDTLAHDAVLRTASWIAVSLFAATAFALAFGLRRPQHRRVLLPLAALSLAVLFALLPPSAPLWQHAPELRFLQFPWRLLALLAVALCAGLAAALSRVRLSSRAVVGVTLPLAALLIVPSWRVDRQPCDLEDAVPARVALFGSTLGTEATDEYTPVDADGDALRPNDPPYWLIAPAAATGDAADAAAPRTSAPGPAPPSLTLTLPAPATLVLNRRAYPAWQIHVNGRPALPHQPAREDGLIAIDLPPGPALVELELHRTPDRTAGLLLSGLAAAVALALARRDRRRWT